MVFAGLPRDPFGGGVDSGLSELPLAFSFAFGPPAGNIGASAMLFGGSPLLFLGLCSEVGSFVCWVFLFACRRSAIRALSLLVRYAACCYLR